MNKEIDLSKYQVRTDLAIDQIEEKSVLKGVKHNTEIIDDIKVTTVKLDEENDLNKKKGEYITLEFEDVTDYENREKITNVLTDVLRKILRLNYDSFGLIVGLGNDKSTPEELATVFNTSKKNFKRALGVLMKKGLIIQNEEGTYLK